VLSLCEIAMRKLAVWSGEIIWVTLNAPQGIVEMMLADGVKLNLGKLSQSLIEPPQLKLQTLYGETLYPAAESLLGHIAIFVGTRYGAPGA
jgi:hypothetical protein